MKQSLIAAALFAPLFTLGAPAAVAQIAVSANDGKVRLENGVVKTVPNNPDTVAIIDLKAKPPKLLYEIEAPTSIVGPPTSAAVTPDGSIALVTANMKLDNSDPPEAGAGQPHVGNRPDRDAARRDRHGRNRQRPGGRGDFTQRQSRVGGES